MEGGGGRAETGARRTAPPHSVPHRNGGACHWAQPKDDVHGSCEGLLPSAEMAETMLHLLRTVLHVARR